jgi:ribosomal protein S18 acetylase RimI-like enzyme
MYNIIFQEIKNVDVELVKKIVKLEKRNLGKDASINEWVIPVIIRYGKVIVAKREKEPLMEEIREIKCAIKEGENSIKKGSKKKSDDTEIIGVCEVIKSWREENAAFIHSFYIDKKYRNKGIGSGLMKKVIDILKNDNIKIIELTVDPANRAANQLYSGYGFKRAGFRKDEYGRGVDRDLMILKL